VKIYYDLQDLDVDTDCIDDIRDFSSLGNHGDTRGGPILVEWNRVTGFSNSIQINNGWNIVSFPGIHPNSMQLDTLFRFWDHSGNLYSYDGSFYIIEDTLKSAFGYWLKHDGDHIYSWDGTVQDGVLYPLLDYVSPNPFNGISGWNIFGIYDYTILPQNLTSDPPGLIDATIYKFGEWYTPADTLFPGRGYWIKLSESGQIIYPTRNAIPKRNSEELINKDWAKIIIKDASGKLFILYSSNETGQLDKYSLPPKPPPGLFDVRFTSDRFVEDISTKKIIEISGAEYPVMIRVEGVSVNISDAGLGEFFSAKIKDGEEIIIENNVLTKLAIVTSGVILIEYKMEQNYPNPFNPSTKIKYSIPINEFVTLKVYNTIGEEIVVLVNTQQQAGNYDVEFNAESLPSGIYYYRIQTGSFTHTKKMILMK